MRTEYIEKLAGMMNDYQMDAVLICPSEELLFLTGFNPMMCERFQGLVICSDGRMFYICNLLYKDQVEAGLGKSVPVYTWFDGDDMVEIVSGILQENHLGEAVIGVNSSAPAYQILDIAGRIPVRFVDAKPLLEEIRIHKTPEEQECLRQAARIADEAFAAILPRVHAGMKEQDVMDLLAEEMTSRGGENPEGIVASGPNSSYPHYNAYGRTIQDHDLCVLDYGCTYKGLHSDMSRTIFIGEPTGEQKKVYDIVDRAQKAAQKAAVEGAFIPDIDYAARHIIDTEGYEGSLVNRVGHGIGYMIHEAPDIKKSDPRKLERGMAFSIEPGIYLAGNFGIRIENIVMINDRGETEVLNQASRKLIVL